MKNRRSLQSSRSHASLPTQLTSAEEDDDLGGRRGGARHGVSIRVVLKGRAGSVYKGWALNVSRGGVRVILEERVELGDEFLVTLTTGADPATSCAGRVVWVQDEPDGVVCGIELVRPLAAGDGG